MNTHPLFEVFLQLPSAVVFSASMQERNIAQRLFQENLWLLGLLSQELDWPRLSLGKQPEKQIEKLVPGHTSHALESLGRLLLCFLCRSPGQRKGGYEWARVRTTRSEKALAFATPLLSILTLPLPGVTSSIILICLALVLTSLCLARTRFLYFSVNTGRKLHSCLTFPARIVVLARLPGSFSFSATTS